MKSSKQRHFMFALDANNVLRRTQHPAIGIAVQHVLTKNWNTSHDFMLYCLSPSKNILRSLCCKHLYSLLLLVFHHPHSFIPGFKPSFSANPSHRSLPFRIQNWLHGFPSFIRLLAVRHLAQWRCAVPILCICSCLQCLQRWFLACAKYSRLDHQKGIRLPHAKFGPGQLKTVATYREQSNRRIKSNQIYFAQNTSHLNAASGKSSWWAGPTRLKRALAVTYRLTRTDSLWYV